MRYRFVAFDLDGVLVDDRSSWEWVHHYFGVDNNDAVQDFMEKKIDDHEFTRRDIELWKSVDPNINLAKVDNILKTAKSMKGSEETVQRIMETGTSVGIVSGGIDLLANRLADVLKINHVKANGLEADENGLLTGEGIIRVSLWDKGGALLKMLAEAEIDPKDCAVVGNSCIDVSMFEAAGFSIAFKPIDEDCADAADVVVRSDDLRDILPYLLD